MSSPADRRATVVNPTKGNSRISHTAARWSALLAMLAATMVAAIVRPPAATALGTGNYVNVDVEAEALTDDIETVDCG